MSAMASMRSPPMRKRTSSACRPAASAREPSRISEISTPSSVSLTITPSLGGSSSGAWVTQALTGAAPTATCWAGVGARGARVSAARATLVIFICILLGTVGARTIPGP